MQLVNSIGRVRNICCMLFILSFLITFTAQSQNIYLDGKSGVLTFGQLSQVEQFGGQAVGLSYSFDGKSAVGISYGASSLNGRDYQNLSLYGNFLLKDQASGYPFNIELTPLFERKYHEISQQNMSLFSMAAGISKDFSKKSDVNFIPRATFSYLMSPSVGVTNFLSAGMDMSFGVNLNNRLKFIVNPGVNIRLDNGSYNGVFTSGLLFH